MSHNEAYDFIVVGAGSAGCAVGTLRMGVGDASVMPNITSANTNAPSIMIGHWADQIIAKDAA